MGCAGQNSELLGPEPGFFLYEENLRVAIYHLCVQDDHSTVRHAALRTLIAILPDVPLEARATCLPALRPLFSQPPPIVTADPAAAEALADAYAAPMPCVLTSNANSHMQSCRTQMCHNASMPTLTQPGAKNGRPWPAHSPLSPRTLW